MLNSSWHEQVEILGFIFVHLLLAWHGMFESTMRNEIAFSFNIEELNWEVVL
jgi:hypothetical protein